jgi:hypothetical protein
MPAMNMPQFEAEDPSAPTRDKLVLFAGQTEIWITGQKMILQTFEIDKAEWPLEPWYSIHTNVSQAGTVFQKVIELNKALTNYDAIVGRIKIQKLEQALQQTRSHLLQGTRDKGGIWHIHSWLDAKLIELQTQMLLQQIRTASDGPYNLWMKRMDHGLFINCKE